MQATKEGFIEESLILKIFNSPVIYPDGDVVTNVTSYTKIPHISENH